MLKTLETSYDQVPLDDLKNAQAIVVLAAGSYDSVADLDTIGQNTANSISRLVMGLRLHRVLHIPIVLSGGRIFETRNTEATIEANFLQSCGIDKRFLIKEEQSRNTVENAKYTKHICQKNNYKTIVLVTSAYHMPRSVKIFKREGINIIPFPTDYKTDKKLKFDLFEFTPSAYNLHNTAVVMKEYLGICAIKLGLQ